MKQKCLNYTFLEWGIFRKKVGKKDWKARKALPTFPSLYKIAEIQSFWYQENWYFQSSSVQKMHQLFGLMVYNIAN